MLDFTPGPWEVWYEYDKPVEAGGLIVRGGVDSAGRHAGIAELLTENVESADSDVAAANRQILGDLHLLAAGPVLLSAAEYCVEFLSDEYPQLTLKKRLQSAIVLAKGGAK